MTLKPFPYCLKIYHVKMGCRITIEWNMFLNLQKINCQNQLTILHPNVYIWFVRSIFRCVLRIMFSVIVNEIKCFQVVFWYYIMQWTVFAMIISYRVIVSYHISSNISLVFISYFYYPHLYFAEISHVNTMNLVLKASVDKNIIHAECIMA